MAKYSDKKAKKIRDAIYETLNASVRLELTEDYKVVVVRVSYIALDLNDNAYIIVEIDYANTVFSYKHYVYMLGEWIEPIKIMGEIMAQIIRDTRYIRERQKEVSYE